MGDLPAVLGYFSRSQFHLPEPMFDILRYNTEFDRENCVWEDDHAVLRLPMNDLRCIQTMLDDLLSTERHVLIQMNRHLRKIIEKKK